MKKNEVIEAGYKNEDGDVVQAQGKYSLIQEQSDKIRKALSDAGREDLLKTLESAEDKTYDLLQKYDIDLALTFKLALGEILKILITPQPKDFRQDRPMEEQDPIILQFVAKQMELKIKAADSLNRMLSTRLPTIKQYDPHVTIGGANYAIPIDEREWTTRYGQLVHLRTVEEAEKNEQRLRNEFEKKLKEFAAHQGFCVGTNDGKCALTSLPPSVSNKGTSPPADPPPEKNNDDVDNPF